MLDQTMITLWPRYLYLITLSLIIITTIDIPIYSLFPSDNRKTQIITTTTTPPTSHHRSLRRHHHPKKPQQHLKGLAWLLTYPNSGTYFTTRLVTKVSHTSTASNYPHDVSNYISSLDDPKAAYTPRGPWKIERYPYPTGGYLLTKTHCNGFCVECPPSEHLKQPDKFLFRCSSTPKYEDAAMNVNHGYNVGFVRRAVHLFRNPFDNIVANFHYKYKVHNARRKNAVVMSYDETWDYSFNEEGFRSWCRDLDERYREEAVRVYPRHVWEAIVRSNVPCFGPFFQYAQWHNNAMAATMTLNIPTLVIHYEDYININATVGHLLDFLELPKSGWIVDFRWNGGYKNYFSKSERVAVAEFLKIISGKETMRALKRYLGKYVSDDE